MMSMKIITLSVMFGVLLLNGCSDSSEIESGIYRACDGRVDCYECLEQHQYSPNRHNIKRMYITPGMVKDVWEVSFYVNCPKKKNGPGGVNTMVNEEWARSGKGFRLLKRVSSIDAY